MDEAIKQIGERLKGLREVLNIPAEEVAELCEISLDHYLKIESGEADPSVYRLSKISKRYGIDLDVLLFGEEPRMKGYYVTRKGQGPEIYRNNQYKYQSLAVGMINSRCSLKSCSEVNFVCLRNLSIIITLLDNYTKELGRLIVE